MGGGATSLLDDALAPRMDAAHAALAKRLVDMGVDLKGANLTPSPFLRFLASNVRNLPGTGMLADEQATQASFTKALARQMGAETARITPEVMGETKARLGAGYDEVAPQLKLSPSDSLLTKLADIQHEASTVLGKQRAEPIGNITDSFLSQFKNGADQAGDSVHAFIKKGSPLSVMQNSRDPDVAHYANQVRSAINDELEA